MTENRTPFDEWASKQSLISDGNETRLWEQPFFADILKNINNPEKIEEIIQQKNQTLTTQYITERLPNLEENKAQWQSSIKQCETHTENANATNRTINAFAADVNKLVEMYPPERQPEIKAILQEYITSNTFPKHLEQKLTGKPKGLIGKLKHGKKIKQANEFFEEFKQKYTAVNISGKLEELKNNNNSDDSYYILKTKVENVVKMDTPALVASIQSFKTYIQSNQTQIETFEKNIQTQQNFLQKINENIANSTAIKADDDFIRQTVTSLAHPDKTKTSSNISDYVERLDKLPDDELIILNIGLAAGNNSTAITNVLAANGLQAGTNTNEWMVRQETLQNSDKDRHELFSPILTVKDAKEILPQLVADFDRLNLTSGLIVPMVAKDVLKDTPEVSISQEEINAGLDNFIKKAIVSAKIATAAGLPPQEQLDAIYAQLGVKSKDELPKTYTSVDQIKKVYTKDECLFTGTMASDDHLDLSARVGRNGTVYATPHIDYAKIYDGAEAMQFGASATGDSYVNTTIGQYNGENVRLGFINIYAQSPDDKYFKNFGMEEYRKDKKSKVTEATCNVCEQRDGQLVDAQRQITYSSSLVLPREQAINGYVESGKAPITIGDKEYVTLSENAETYVTPEKNPLKTKIMHIQYGGNGSPAQNLYIEVPQEPDKFISQLLASRKADMKTTFSTNKRGDVLERFTAQQREFKAGIVHPARPLQANKTLPNAMLQQQQTR